MLVENLIKKSDEYCNRSPIIDYSNADKIMVLHHGEIQEFGTWDDLVTKNGRFAAMVKAQSSQAINPIN